MDQDLKRYKALVTEMFELDSTEPFFNGQPSHAAAIFAEMLRRSQSQVVIFCKELAESVFDEERDMIPALRGALRRNVDVSIIVQESPKSPKFLAKANQFFLDELLPGEVSIVGCSDEHQAVKNLSLNFAVMDKKAIRAEYDKGECKALACANDPERAKTLLENFRKIKSYLEDNGGGTNLLALTEVATTH